MLSEKSKNQIRNHRISPSDESWSRLNNKLKRKQKRPTYLSMIWKIAAVGIILLGYFFLANFDGSTSNYDFAIEDQYGQNSIPLVKHISDAPTLSAIFKQSN